MHCLDGRPQLAALASSHTAQVCEDAGIVNSYFFYEITNQQAVRTKMLTLPACACGHWSPCWLVLAGLLTLPACACREAVG